MVHNLGKECNFQRSGAGKREFQNKNVGGRFVKNTFKLRAYLSDSKEHRIRILCLTLYIFFRCPLGLVVSVNATVRLLNEEWSDGLKNTTSEPLVNLSRKIEFNVSVMIIL